MPGAGATSSVTGAAKPCSMVQTGRLRRLLKRATGCNGHVTQPVQGIVSLGLENWQVGGRADEQDAQIEKLLQIICDGLN